MATIDASIVIIAMPAIFRGIHLDPLAPGNVSYLLWMIIGYLLVTAVPGGHAWAGSATCTAGCASTTWASWSSRWPRSRCRWTRSTGSSGALWLIGWRLVQAFGGAMLMSNSAAILTDAFPAGKRGMALGVNQIAGISGQFVGLLLGGLLAACGLARGVLGERADRGRSARSGPTGACARSPPPGGPGSTGRATSPSALGADRAAGRDHLRHPALRRAPDRLDQPVGARPGCSAGRRCWSCSCLIETQDRRAHVPAAAVPDPGVRGRQRGQPARLDRPRRAAVHAGASGWPGSGCRCTATTSWTPRCGRASTCCR